jgi:glutaredoxin
MTAEVDLKERGKIAYNTNVDYYRGLINFLNKLFNMKNKAIFFVLALSVVVLSGCGQNNNSSESTSNPNVQGTETVKDDASIIFFFGKECPHCKVVEKYFEDNKTAEKVSFSQREVYHDKGNAALMIAKAAGCGIAEKDLGVPMLWADGKCLFGEKDIEQFFDSKINENK